MNGEQDKRVTECDQRSSIRLKMSVEKGSLSSRYAKKDCGMILEKRRTNNGQCFSLNVSHRGSGRGKQWHSRFVSCIITEMVFRLSDSLPTTRILCRFVHCAHKLQRIEQLKNNIFTGSIPLYFFRFTPGENFTAFIIIAASFIPTSSSPALWTQALQPQFNLRPGNHVRQHRIPRKSLGAFSLLLVV